MELLATLHDRDIGSSTPAPASYKERNASRAIVYDAERNIALLHATNKNYHKLPGGGVEEGEDIEAALRREVLEEIGCNIINLKELGIIEEYRNEFALHQTSHCFLADVDGLKGSPNLEQDELADGFETVWLDVPTAIANLESEASLQAYEGKFIRLRDLLFLKKVQSL
jgi:8-oxo-dGTP diphosphatase